MKIREAKIKDVDDPVDLWQELMNYHMDLSPNNPRLKKNARSMFTKWVIKHIKSKNSIVLIANDKKGPVGYMLGYVTDVPKVYIEDKMSYISDSYITKVYRKKGIMKKMVKQAKIFFKKKKMKHIYLRADTLNILGVKSWNKIGFKEEAKEMYMKI